MLSRIKEKVRGILDPVARPIARRGIHPNVLTLAGLAVGAASALLLGMGMEAAGGLLLLVCGVFDILDGAVARIGGMTTAFGGVLDSTIDRLLDFAVLAAAAYGGLAEAGWIPGWLWCMIAIEGSFMVSYLRARAEAAGATGMDIGIAERSERIIVLGIGALAGFLRYAIVLVAILTNLTLAQRLAAARRKLR